MELIYDLAIILFAAKVAGAVSVRLGQPAVLGKLLIGIVLGPTLLGLVNDTEILEELSEIGVILLMFIAGLETDIQEFKKNSKSSIAVGAMGILIPFGTGYAGGLLFNMSVLQSLFLGLILSATSVSISVQTLREIGKLKSREGAVILGAAVIDDLLVMAGLAIVLGMTGEQVNVGFVVLKMISFIGLAALLGWKLIPWILKKFAPLKITEAVVSAGLIIVFTYAYLAEMTGVAAIIGAYIAGIAISVTDYKTEMTRKVETIGNSIFIPVFFASIGIKAEFSGIAGELWFALLFSIIAILAKWIGAAIGAKSTGFPLQNSYAIGTAMISRGEVALIISALGLKSGIMNEDLFAPIIAIILVTTVISPPLMKAAFSKVHGQENRLKS